MNDQPLVSVIIPTYNRAYLIGETLDSVLAQTYQNWECVVVDDGSNDNTDEVVGTYVEKDKRFKYYHRPEEHLPGGNGARNYGFKMSQGEYVNWFDSDDLMLPEKLEIQVNLLLKTNKNFCVCQTMVFEDNIDNKLGLRKKNVFSKNPLNDFILGKIFWLTQSPIIKSFFIIQNQLKFDESLKKGQEFDFFIKLLAYESKYCFTDTPLVYLRIHENRISNTKKFDALKTKSIFWISYRALENYRSLLEIETVNKLLNNQLKQIIYCLDRKQSKVADELFLAILKNIGFNKKSLRLLVGFCSYKFFKKGKFYFLNSLKVNKTIICSIL